MPVETPPVERLGYRLADAAAAIGIGRRTLERLRSAGKFPKPDAQVGKMPIWRPETIRAYLEQSSQ